MFIESKSGIASLDGERVSTQVLSGKVNHDYLANTEETKTTL
jgi:hypothetical protein